MRRRRGAGRREWGACAREVGRRRSLELATDECLELRAGDAEVLACLDERGAGGVERALRGEEIEKRGCAERVPLLLHADVFACRLDGDLLERDALLRGAQGAELLDEILLGGQ